MKKIYALFFAAICIRLSAQAPQSINYQGVLRDQTGVPISSVSIIGVRFTITDGASNVVHLETQNGVPVSSLGLFSTRIGISPAISNTITWQSGPYNLAIAVDMGTGFVPMGSQQLVSVPFALYAQNAPSPTLQLNGNNLSISGGNTVTLPGGGGNYSGGMGISLSGSVIINTAPDQTVVLSNGTNINVSGTYPTFTIASNPTLNLQGNLLDISGGNTVTLPTGTTYTSGPGISIVSGTIITNTAPNQTVNITGPQVTGSYPNYTISSSPSTTITSGNSNITVSGAAPNYTISSTPSLALAGNTLSISNGNSVVIPAPPPPTSITGIGVATVTGAAPSFSVNVPLLSLSGAGSSTVFGAYPSFTVSSPAAITPTINGSGIAVVSPTTGNNFTVSVTTPTFIGVLGTTVTGVYPSYTLASPLPVSPTITGVGNSTVTGAYPNWTVSSNPAWLLLGNAGTNPATNFIGTTDNNPISFRTNNIRSGKLDPGGQTFYGYQSGLSSTGASLTGVGFQALFSNTSGNNNTAFGYASLFSNTTGGGNTAVGDNAMRLNTGGVNNTALGLSVLYSNTSGNSNTGAGAGALYSNTNGASNIAYGGSALYFNTGGNNNNAFGGFALYNNATGNNNVAIGGSAGYNSTGSGNVFIGNQAGYNANSSNQLWIANTNIGVPLMFGDFSTARIGLGTTSPSDKLHLFSASNERVRVESSGSGGTAEGIFQTDNSATNVLGIYKGGSVIGGSTAGIPLANLSHIYAGATAGGLLLQVVSNNPMYFATANTERMRIDASGNVGIANTAPAAPLDVNGTVLISGANTNELNRTQTTDANLAPVAYANINSNGTVNTGASTSNVTLASHTIGSGLYYFNIGGESIYYLNHVGIATLVGSNGEIMWSSAGGQLAIFTYDSSGNPTDKQFTFVIYRK
jgi:hypothetical protein